MLQQGLHHGLGFEWYLQEITIPFEYLSSAKLSEISKTVAHRLFPMSRWIFWADGKGRINMKEALGRATTPFLGRPHDRKMETEVGPTLVRRTQDRRGMICRVVCSC